MRNEWDRHTREQTSALDDTGQFRTYLDRQLASIDPPAAPRRSTRWIWFAVFAVGVLIGFGLHAHLAH
ncbi:MAG TPA: hypothetical protein VGG49_13115 [Steroidobacteraceae bacterium]|jgi:hypothetical protein